MTRLQLPRILPISSCRTRKSHLQMGVNINSAAWRVVDMRCKRARSFGSALFDDSALCSVRGVHVLMTSLSSSYARPRHRLPRWHHQRGASAVQREGPIHDFLPNTTGFEAAWRAWHTATFLLSSLVCFWTYAPATLMYVPGNESLSRTWNCRKTLQMSWGGTDGKASPIFRYSSLLQQTRAKILSSRRKASFSIRFVTVLMKLFLINFEYSFWAIYRWIFLVFGECWIEYWGVVVWWLRCRGVMIDVWYPFFYSSMFLILPIEKFKICNV